MNSRKFILNFSPTGLIPTKTMTPHVPVARKEVVVQVLEAISLGANMIHLHARDQKTGEPTYKKEIYQKIIEGIRKHDKNIILGVSTSGRVYDNRKGKRKGKEGGMPSLPFSPHGLLMEIIGMLPASSHLLGGWHLPYP